MKTIRQLEATGGVNNGTGWLDGSEVGFVATAAAAEYVCQIVQAPTADAADQPTAAIPVFRFYGGSIVLSTSLAAAGALSLIVNIRRAGAQLGSAGCYGWRAAGGGTPAFTAWVPVVLPDLHANNTALQQDGGAGPFFVPLLATDVITLQFAGTVPSVPAGLVQLTAH